MSKLLTLLDKLFRKDAERVVVRITEERAETVRVIDWVVVIFGGSLIAGGLNFLFLFVTGG